MPQGSIGVKLTPFLELFTAVNALAHLDPVPGFNNKLKGLSLRDMASASRLPIEHDTLAVTSWKIPYILGLTGWWADNAVATPSPTFVSCWIFRFQS